MAHYLRNVSASRSLTRVPARLSSVSFRDLGRRDRLGRGLGGRLAFATLVAHPDAAQSYVTERRIADGGLEDDTIRLLPRARTHRLVEPRWSLVARLHK